MKKSLIALAVAGAFVAPAAMADEVKVYGAVDVNFGSVSNGSNSALNVGSSVSKIGFKGSEDLGDGLSAIWQIEQQVDVDQSNAASGTSGNSNGHATFAGRNSFGGLKGGFGTVLMGTHDTPYKISTRHLDVFGDQVADNRAIMGGAGAADARTANTLAYISPNMSNFTVAAAYVAGAEIPAAAGTSTKKGSAISLAGIYDDGTLHAAAAYQSITYGSSNSGSLTSATSAGDSFNSTKVGVGYKVMSNLKINAVVESLSGTGTLKAVKQTNVYVAGVFGVTANDDIKAAYTKGGKVNNVANTGANQISVGYDHKLSKTTKVYAQYSSISNGSAATYSICNCGYTGGGFPVAAGKTASAMVVGINHKF